MKRILVLFMALLCALSLMLTACTQEETENPASDSATESVDAVATDATESTDAAASDATDEAKATINLTVDVVDADGNTKTFTFATDADNLADALLAEKLVEGEQGEYGLYIKSVNGVRADYDLDKAYWALYSNGEMLMTGASDTAIADGQHYELVYTPAG